MGLLANRQVAAHVCIILVIGEELILAHENLSQPLENIRVVLNLVLNQLLRDGEQNLRAEQSNKRIHISML